MNAQEFVEKIESIEYMGKKYGHEFSYRGREVYVLQDLSKILPVKTKTTAYDHWKSHPSFKIASSIWLLLENIPLTELAILLNDEDPIEGEYRKDLGYAWDNSETTTNSKNYRCGLELKEGRIIRVDLNSPNKGRSLLNKILIKSPTT